MQRVYPGKCYFCGETFGKTAMNKHLDKCKVRAEKNAVREERYFRILVQGYYQKEYWMYIEISVKATLKDLDDFLRVKWLECCGHLSMFRIDKETFDSQPDLNMFEGSKSMKVRVKEKLFEDLEFIHEYDFGSTTILKLKVLSEYKAEKRKEKIVLMGRNLPISYKCLNCGEEATQFCMECINQSEAYYCNKCAKEHDCGEDILLPVTNSPRMGVCAYCGGDED